MTHHDRYFYINRQSGPAVAGFAFAQYYRAAPRWVTESSAPLSSVKAADARDRTNTAESSYDATTQLATTLTPKGPGYMGGRVQASTVGSYAESELSENPGPEFEARNSVL